MQIAHIETASSGAYIWVPNGNGDFGTPSENTGYVTYTFRVPTDGTYFMWGRIIANNASEDSFFVSIDGGDYITWVTKVGEFETWTWDQLRDGPVADEKTVTLELQAGQHTLLIRHREDGIKLDKILISDDLKCIPIE